jgi:heme exporter protein A
MLEACSVACVRGARTLFNDVSFSLDPGMLLRIAGANGSGKTSLLRIVCGLASPAQGDVLWQGEPVRKQREEFHRQLVYIGHLAAVKEELTASENLSISSALSGRLLEEHTLDRARERMGLGAHAHLPARHLSQGQRRRVALARLAACTDAKLWVLDEPFTALDATAITVTVDLITEHLARGGIAVITSHQDVMFAAVTTCIVDLGG